MFREERKGCVKSRQLITIATITKELTITFEITDKKFEFKCFK